MAFRPGDRRFQGAPPAMAEAVDRAERLRQISFHQAQADALERQASSERSLQLAEALRRRAEVRRAWVERLRNSVPSAVDG